MKQGPRIYNLFPTLAGSIDRWIEHVPRIAAMEFNWIYVNPFHETGYSGSLYAVKNYERLNPLFRGKSRASDRALLKRFVDRAAQARVGVMMDLVINHTARDADLVTAHPEWYRRDASGEIESPSASDPADPANVTVWTDLAELDFTDRPARDAMIAFFAGVIKQYIELGVRGFRCDAAYKVPADVWAALIAGARREMPDVLFAAENLGAPLESVLALRSAGFDYLFNSAKWWDFRSPWLLEQYEQFRSIAPSIAFPESHDTPRLSAEANDASDAAIEAEYRFRYLFAAVFSSGVMMPMGFEYGFARATARRLHAPGALGAAALRSLAVHRRRQCDEGIDSRAQRGRPVARALSRRYGVCAGAANGRRALRSAGADQFEPSGFRNDRRGCGLAGRARRAAAGSDAGRIRHDRARHHIAAAHDPRLCSGGSAHRAGACCRRGRRRTRRCGPAVRYRRHRAANRRRPACGEARRGPAFRRRGWTSSAKVTTPSRPGCSTGARGAPDWNETPMHPLGNDRWSGDFVPDAVGTYEYTIEAWPDDFETWAHGTELKHAAGQPVALELNEGRALVAAAAERGDDAVGPRLAGIVAAFDRAASDDEKLAVLLSGRDGAPHGARARPELRNALRAGAAADRRPARGRNRRMVRNVSAFAVLAAGPAGNLRGCGAAAAAHCRARIRRRLSSADPSDRRLVPQGPQQQPRGRARRSRQPVGHRER